MITTFYSYKGGVGRTSTAIETAARLACGTDGRPPLRVLLWDLDLEAPGIRHFPVVGEMSARASAGTLDLLELLWADGGTAGEVAVDEIDEVISKGVITDSSVAAGRLGVFATNAGGAIDRDRLSRLDLPALFGTGAGAPRLLRLTAERMQDQFGWDVVIVDARTGVSDLAATATVAIPDALVFVLRMDEQELANIEQLLASIRLSRDRARANGSFQIIPVATFVPNPGEDVLLAERLEARRREVVRRMIAPSSHLKRLNIEIPFRMAALLDESVPTLDRTPLPSETAQSYERLAGEIADLARPAVEALPDEERTKNDKAFGRLVEGRDGGASLIDEVAQLLALDGWRVARDRFVGVKRFDLVIERMGAFGRPQLGVVQVKALNGRYDGARVSAFQDDVVEARQVEARARGLIVASSGFTENAREVADAEDVDLATPLELLRSLAPLDPLRAAARREWANTEAESRYVPLTAAPLEPGDTEEGRARVPLDDTEEGRTRVPLDDLVSEWLRSAVGGGLLAVLGGSGAGKTTFVRNLAYRLAATEDETSPVALVVDLKTARAPFPTIRTLIEHAVASAGIEDVKYVAWLHLLTRTRSLVLVVDGYDEMLAYSDPKSMRALLGELLELASRARIVLTSRTNYFLTPRPLGAASSALDGTSLATNGTGLWRELTSRGKARAVEIESFDDRQVEKYLGQVFAGRGEMMAKRIAQSAPVAAITHRPYLLKLVAGTIELWERESWPRSINATELYETYVDAWQHDRNSLEDNSLLTGERAGDAIDLVARAAWNAKATALTSSELTRVVEDEVMPILQSNVGAGAVQRVTDELRTASFLAGRDVEDRYSFVHNSFLEFFVARGLAAALRRGDDAPLAFIEALDGRRFTPDVAAFLLGWTDILDPLAASCAAILGDPYRQRVSENALVLMVQLRRRRDPSRGAALPATPTSLGVEGRIRLATARLRGADLADVDLADADLSGAHLEAAQLRGASMERALLDGAVLDGALLTGASARAASLVGAQARHVFATRFDLSRAHLGSAAFDGAVLEGANLTSADCTKTSFVAARLDDARMARVVLEGADLRAASVRTDLDETVLPRSAKTAGARLGWPSAAAVRRRRMTLRTGHSDYVRSVAAAGTSRGPIVATSGDDQTVRVWDPITGELLQTLLGHVAWVRAVTFLVDETKPKGRSMLLASGGDEGAIRLWRSSGELVSTMETQSGGGVRGLATVRGEGEPLLVSATDDAVEIWSASAGARLRLFDLDDGEIGSVATLGAWHQAPIVVVGQGSIGRVLDATTGASVCDLVGHTGAVTATTAFRSGGRDLIGTGGADGTIRVWDARSGARQDTFDDHVGGIVTSLASYMTQAGDVHLVSTSDEGGVLIHRIGDDRPTRLGHRNRGLLAVTAFGGPGGEPVLAGAGADGALVVWDPSTTETLRTMERARGVNQSLVYAGPTPVSLGHDGVLRRWDVSDGGAVPFGPRFPTASDMSAAAHDGGLLVAAASSDGSVWVSNLDEVDRAVASSTHPGHFTHTVCWVADEQQLRVAGSSTDGIDVWDGASGELIRRLSVETGWNAPLAMVVVGGSRLLARAGGADNSEVHLWEPDSGTAAGIIGCDLSYIVSLAGSAGHDALVAVADWEGRVQVLDVASGRGSRLLNGHTDTVNALQFYPTARGTMLASASTDGTVSLWNPFTGRRLRVLERHTDAVESVVVVGGDTTRPPAVVSSSADGTTIVWDPTTGAARHQSIALADRPEALVTLRLERAVGGAKVVGDHGAAVAAVVAGPYDGEELLRALPDAFALSSGSSSTLRHRGRRRASSPMSSRST